MERELYEWGHLAEYRVQRKDDDTRRTKDIQKAIRNDNSTMNHPYEEKDVRLERLNAHLPIQNRS